MSATLRTAPRARNANVTSRFRAYASRGPRRTLFTDNARMTRRRLRQAAAILGGWTLLAVLFLPQNFVANSASETPLPRWVTVVLTASIFYVWAALTPLVIWLATQVPLRRDRLVRTTLFHLVMSVVTANLHLIVLSIVHLLFPQPPDYEPPMAPELVMVTMLASNVMLYWSIVVLTVTFTYIRRDHERELTLVQAQLESLRGRLQPHFLFNTLNAIAELLYADPKRAEETVTQLSDVLRLTLQHDQAPEITLAEELDLLRKHVALYETLLHERLRVRWSIAPDTLGVKVPTMIFQPLVENAIRHGIAPRDGGGTVEVSARRDGQCLLLAVEDDGVGMKSAAPEGIGLSNTRARLRYMYGEAFTLDIRQPANGGVAVEMKVPMR